MPKSEDFYDFYDDNQWDIVLLEEFRGQKTIQFLNEFCQGSMMTLRQKGKQALKVKNLPMIVLSNYRLTEVYSKSLANDASRLDTLRTRFFELHFDTPIDTRAIGEALGLSSSEIDAILLPPPDPLSSIIPVDDGVALPPPDLS